MSDNNQQTCALKGWGLEFCQSNVLGETTEPGRQVRCTASVLSRQSNLGNHEYSLHHEPERSERAASSRWGAMSDHVERFDFAIENEW